MLPSYPMPKPESNERSQYLLMLKSELRKTHGAARLIPFEVGRGRGSQEIVLLRNDLRRCAFIRMCRSVWVGMPGDVGEGEVQRGQGVGMLVSST